MAATDLITNRRSSTTPQSTRAVTASTGLRVQRRHTTVGENPLESLEWELRNAVITGEGGEIVFEQNNVEVPKQWSQLATNVVVSKYFRGQLNTPARETSARQMISRVVDTLHHWGIEGGYFASDVDAQAFRDELAWYLAHQWLSFNSPVWFNAGIDEHPQCSACFINSVSDDMESIMTLAATEARLFKGGSGAGVNLSPLRSSKEHLAGGGTASGPVSFMRGFDAFAGVIKSGGKTRRAAKMVILNVDHPDILEFINCKADEEKKAWALIDAGYDGSFNGEAYSSIYFQNSNNSVRVTDDFMRAVENDQTWQTRAVRDGSVLEEVKASEIWSAISDAAHLCGDPGLQFDSTINDWHTCSVTGRIDASNPCSEYMFLNNTACNLASLNLVKFLQEDGSFDVENFEHAISVVFTGMEIIVGRASYPTQQIAQNSFRYRPLGLGYANLGALLMAQGLPYDSVEGRAYAGALTSILCGAAYRTSAIIAQHTGPFDGYAENREPMLRVMRKHRDASQRVDQDMVPENLYQASLNCWNEALELGERYGYRNAQATVLAPTGTIGFMMDCDTTGIEPDIALVKYKKLVGGGYMKIVNNTVPRALAKLGYSPIEVEEITQYIDKEDTIEGAPHLKVEDLPVFDCAFRAANGVRSISPMGHVRMMAAAQPFLSGAISKTVNVPSEATAEQIGDIYLEGWKLGLKALAVYRDGCKRLQPLNVKGNDTEEAVAVEAVPVVEQRPRRRRLPNERQAITHKFSVGGHEGYLTVGLYEDGTPGEIFVVMSKQGSTICGLMDAMATSISMALQYGVPLPVLCDKFSHTRFEPSGWTQNSEIPLAKSILDYIFRWLTLKFLNQENNAVDASGEELQAEERVRDGHRQADEIERQAASGPNEVGTSAPQEEEPEMPIGLQTLMDLPADDVAGQPTAEMLRTYLKRHQKRQAYQAQTDAPPCHVCGSLTYRSGSCYKCPNCGADTGCG